MAPRPTPSLRSLPNISSTVWLAMVLSLFSHGASAKPARRNLSRILTSSSSWKDPLHASSEYVAYIWTSTNGVRCVHCREPGWGRTIETYVCNYTLVIVR
ncbi:hypothetical protein GE21DRAFT_1279967 [Neurospora crassa]|nr:hypothetical protein GE21DRAFT_1279967 [Neurospora crassa]